VGCSSGAGLDGKLWSQDAGPGGGLSIPSTALTAGSYFLATKSTLSMVKDTTSHARGRCYCASDSTSLRLCHFISDRSA
jgi:hypothetical protein